MTLVCSSETCEGPEGSQRTPRGGESQVRRAASLCVDKMAFEAWTPRGKRESRLSRGSFAALRQPPPTLVRHLWNFLEPILDSKVRILAKFPIVMNVVPFTIAPRFWATGRLNLISFACVNCPSRSTRRIRKSPPPVAGLTRPSSWDTVNPSGEAGPESPRKMEDPFRNDESPRGTPAPASPSAR